MRRRFCPPWVRLVLVRRAYQEFLTANDTKQEIQVRRGEDNDLTSLGFKNVEFEGFPLTWEFGIPETPSNPAAKTLHGYGINLWALQLMFANDKAQLCEGDSAYDEDQRVYKFWVETLGNLFIRSPRLLSKIADYA